MSILTEEEIDGLGLSAATKADVRDIESAVLAKLAGMELPKPALHRGGRLLPYEQRYFSTPGMAEKLGYTQDPVNYYTAAQLHQAYAQGAASQLAQKPEAWSVTYNGLHVGNFNLKLHDAEDKCASLNRVYPCDKREVVPLYTLKEPK